MKGISKYKCQGKLISKMTLDGMLVSGWVDTKRECWWLLSNDALFTPIGPKCTFSLVFAPKMHFNKALKTFQ